MSNNKPSHRISFARIVSTDGMGNDKLGSARAIGAIWPRETGKGAILRFDHIPVELARHNGVIFVNEVGSD